MPSPALRARLPKERGHRQRVVRSRQSLRLVVRLLLSTMICPLRVCSNQANAPQQTDRLKRENYWGMLLLRIIVPVVYR